MAGLETETVLSRVRAGDVEAFAEVVREHQASVWRTVAFALRDIETTRDLVQQVFVRAYQRLDSFEDGRDLGAWLRGIARNLVREELRRRSREDRRMEAYRQHLEASLADREAAERHERALHDALARCREEIPEPGRQALALRYEQALSFDEIARELGRTVAASRQLLQRLRLKLRTCIETRMAS